MGIALAFRVAVALGVAGQRIVKWAEGPGVAQLPQSLEDRLRNPAESDAELELAVSAATGRVASVTTYAAPFEIRRLQARWQRVGGGSIPEDVAVTTHDFLRLTAGAPSLPWVEADFVAAEDAFDGFWNAIRSYFPTGLTLDELRWYRAGPAIVPPQAPVRVVDRNIPGQAGGNPLPPQVAISVTERTTVRARWGRFYLPWPAVGSLAPGNGRILTAAQTAIADAADAMYEAVRTANIPGVVYSPTTDTALSVDTVQVDDLFDVIRSRRWSNPLLRVQRAVG